MVSLAALPGIMQALLMIGGLVNPGNSSKAVNSVGSQLRFAGLVAMVGLILETGLTPETAEAFIEEQIAEFEKLAISRTTRKSPKWSRRPRRPRPPSP